MDMPINIVPAPNSGLVALYLKTTSPDAAINSAVHRIEADELYVENRVFYIIRPVVAWGFYRDHDELWLTNHAMVADSTGALVFAGIQQKHLSRDIACMSDIDSEDFPVDSVCTTAEVEARLAFIAEAAPKAEFVRKTAAQFTDEYRLTLPHPGK